MDASAAEGGDGSPGRPFRSLAAALTSGARHLRLAAGVHPGGVAVEDVWIEGQGDAVIAASPPDAALTARGQTRLARVQLQGGATGLRVAAGTTELDGVAIGGQRGPAAIVVAGATLVDRSGAWRASVSGQPGLVVEPGGSATLEGTRLDGPFERAVQAESPAALHVRGVSVRGAVMALRIRGGEATVERLRVSGGRGPALSVTGGRLHLADVAVEGHEYALLTGGDAEVDGHDLRSERAQRAGLGLVRARVTLERVVVRGAGDFGAIQLVAADARLTDVEVVGGTSSGVTARGGSLVLARARLTAIGTGQGTAASAAGLTPARDASGGDAVQLRGGSATLTDVVVDGCTGVGIQAAESARVVVQGGSIRAAAVAGVGAETEASLEVRGLGVERCAGPAAVVLHGATARLVDVRATENQGAIWAECNTRASVRVEGWTGTPAPQPTACVSVSAGAPSRDPAPR